jgi:DNA-binding beta-propeller fold protein YncE
MRFIVTSVAMLLCFPFAEAEAAGAAKLRLSQTIPLSRVEGRIDHLAVDVPGERLFVCALGNDSVEVIDLQRGERVHSITGLGAPQGVAYASAEGRLYVANDKGGVCNIYDGKSIAPIGSLDLKDDADNARYDNSAKRIYVGYGNGDLAIIDAASATLIGSIELSGHPEAFVLEKQGPRIFINVPTAGRVAVADRKQGKVVATWKTGAASANFPIALDEGNKRLFVGCRQPAEIVVLNTDSGSLVTSVPIAGDTDDICYDATRHRLYAICGAGHIQVIDQVDRDNYKVAESISTAAGARTGLFVPELNSLFVAIPHRGNQQAEIRYYRTE